MPGHDRSIDDVSPPGEPPREDAGAPEPQGRAAFDVDLLYQEHARALFAWASLRLGPELRLAIGPADLAQEVWLRVTRLASRRDAAHGSPRAWLFAVAKLVLYEVQRDVRRRRAELPAGGSTQRLDALNEIPPEVTSLTQRLARDDAVRVFLARAAELDETDRKLLIHIGLEAMPQTEVAARLEMGYEALAKRWQRLRARVRDWPIAREIAEDP